jgi:GDP-L-fucose synthase
MSDRQKKRGIPYDRRILVTGATGFFGKNLMPMLHNYYSWADIVDCQGKRFFDLTRPNHVDTMFKSMRLEGYIDSVIHLAAYSGGMFENMERPASFYYQNMMMVLNMIEACASAKVQKLLIPFGACSYPDLLDKDLFKEEDLWEGFPHINSFGYSMAKKQAVAAGMAYEKQSGLKTITVIPTNPIGPWDNVDPKTSHVPMALIGKFLEAKKEGYGAVTIAGSGKPERDFLYIKDIVYLFPLILDKYKGPGPMNISSGKGTTIAELAETIAKVVGYAGQIIFDTSKPDGQMRKILDNTKVKDFLKSENVPWEPVSLDTAIADTVEWYRKRVLGE